jgi:glutamate-ammonia-ligase adenylyltransferase
MEGLRNYFIKHAHPWEIQSLLRARPVAGDANLMRAFRHLKRQIILRRGSEITGSGTRDMRMRIIREISKEASGYDLKNGPGGIKEIEFLIQYLQLTHVSAQPDLIVHNPVTAARLLGRYNILDSDTVDLLLHGHRFLRTVDTLLRLNEEDVLKINSELADIIMKFLNLRSKVELIEKIEKTRKKVIGITEIFYTKNICPSSRVEN